MKVTIEAFGATVSVERLTRSEGSSVLRYTVHGADSMHNSYAMALSHLVAQGLTQSDATTLMQAAHRAALSIEE